MHTYEDYLEFYIQSLNPKTCTYFENYQILSNSELST